MGYESLIFDIDGTLWDSRDLVAEGYNQQLHDEGLDDYFVDAQRLRPLFGKVMTAIADELFPHLPPQERYSLLERCIERENQYLSENECRIIENDSGLHFILVLNTELSDKQVKENLLKSKIRIKAVTDYYMDRETKDQHQFILNYSNLVIEGLENAISEMKKALQP